MNDKELQTIKANVLKRLCGTKELQGPSNETALLIAKVSVEASVLALQEYEKLKQDGKAD